MSQGTYIIVRFIDKDTEEEFSVWYENIYNLAFSKFNRDSAHIMKLIREGTINAEMIDVKYVSDDVKSNSSDD